VFTAKKEKIGIQYKIRALSLPSALADGQNRTNDDSGFSPMAHIYIWLKP